MPPRAERIIGVAVTTWNRTLPALVLSQATNSSMFSTPPPWKVAGSGTWTTLSSVSWMAPTVIGLAMSDRPLMGRCVGWVWCRRGAGGRGWAVTSLRWLLAPAPGLGWAVRRVG